MKNVLVTGGAGFIGSNFIHFILQNRTDVHVINLDALTYAGSLENLKDLPDPDRHTFIKGNICNQPLVENVFREYNIDTVFHFAAESHVDRSIVDPGSFIQTNIVGTFTLIEAARKYWIEDKAFGREIQDKVRFHHVSTDEVFGTLEPDEPPFSERTSYNPNSPYAASKAASDHLVRSYGTTYGLPFSITNCSNNYGPRQFPEKLIPLIIGNALEGKTLPIYGDGQQIRDWLYVDDHCEAILAVAEKGAAGQTYTIGGGNQPTNLTVVETICDILDELQPASEFIPHSKLIKHVTDRPGHDRRYAMDITKVKKELGWQPHQSLKSGLLKTVRWYLNNADWVEAIRHQQEYQNWIDKNYTEKNR